MRLQGGGPATACPGRRYCGGVATKRPALDIRAGLKCLAAGPQSATCVAAYDLPKKSSVVSRGDDSSASRALSNCSRPFDFMIERMVRI